MPRSGWSPLVLVVLILAAPADGLPGTPRVISRAELVAAMRRCQGYDPTATTNGARFHAEVLLHLLRGESGPDPEKARLFLDHRDWYAAYLERTGRTAETAPLFARLSFEHRQDVEGDARPGRVIERVVEGEAPRLAANVVLGWPAREGGKSRYSYDDTLAIPDLRVTNERVIVYRLLDYGDVVVFDAVEGLRGRPTEGILGVLFQVIGEGWVRWNRMAISPDGLQLARTRVTKGPFSAESTITVFPDGRVQKDVPPDRPDLLALERRLLQPRRVRYVPLGRERAPAERVADGGR